MEFADLVVSKVSPTNRDEPRHKTFIVILEVKHSGTPVPAALAQLSRYSWRTNAMRHPLRHDNKAFPAYLLYGTHYTRLEYAPHPRIQQHQAEPWQHIFQKLDQDAGVAPLAYRMAELAVRHWDL